MAGPVQTREDPIGEGHRLRQWMFRADKPGHEADARLREQIVGGRGAFIMGRNMHGPIRGEWGDEDGQGWRGEEPPYHAQRSTSSPKASGLTPVEVIPSPLATHIRYRVGR